MRQALHILKKDIRYLWFEICVVIALATLSIWVEVHSSNPWWIEGLLAVSAVYLIARLILAEAIPGDGQYWITRPYCWNNLLAAKVLFIVAFVNLPIFVGRLMTLVALGFPMRSSLSGFLWSELMIFLAGSVPVAALASLTASLVSFTFTMVILLAIIFAVQELSVLPASLPFARLAVEPMQWFWDFIVVAILVIAAFCILYTQYRTRRTTLGRSLGLSAVVLGAVAYLFVPWPWALFFQTHLSRHSLDTSSMRVEIKPNSERLSAHGGKLVPTIDFVVSVNGVPDNTELRGDALAVVLKGVDGRAWKSGLYVVPGLSKKPGSGGRANFDAFVSLDPGFFQAELGRNITLHGSIYLTLFGNRRSNTIEIQRQPVNVMDGLQCYAGEFNGLKCRAPFRWPERLVYAKFSESDVRSFTSLISYSPFPAALNLADPIETRELSAPPSLRQVTILVEQPIEQFRLDFEIPSVHIEDLAVPSKAN